MSNCENRTYTVEDISKMLNIGLQPYERGAFQNCPHRQYNQDFKEVLRGYQIELIVRCSIAKSYLLIYSIRIFSHYYNN